MIIECTNCHSRYQYDEAKFGGKPSKKIKCARCQQVFEIFNPAPAAQPAPAAALDRRDEPPGERTAIGRRTTSSDDARAPAVAAVAEPAATSEAAAPASGPMQLPHGKRLSLAIIDGPDAGSVFRLSKPRITIGRQGADLTLNDNDASRQHAAVEVRDTAYTLRDLQSTNGTLVEGQKISGPVELQNHSEFQIGSSTLMLIVTDES